MLDQKYIFLFLISCEQQHDSKMKNNSVSYFFTQRDRQTDPPTAAAAVTTVRLLSEALRQARTRGVVGPGSEEGFSPLFLLCQPMLHLVGGFTWADPSLWFFPVSSCRACSHIWGGLGEWCEGSHEPPKRQELMLRSKQAYNPTNLLHG